ncbi:hypothetical protein WJX72_012521 [[Myrmecia] bisecta]|uniref:cGMP-dependent protein kinase n=1 Tax=[Myrmecia] bisecta TaxID=41462 RepID=A0AAW1Q935_9CHLO
MLPQRAEPFYGPQKQPSVGNVRLVDHLLGLFTAQAPLSAPATEQAEVPEHCLDPLSAEEVSAAADACKAYAVAKALPKLRFNSISLKEPTKAALLSFEQDPRVAAVPRQALCTLQLPTGASVVEALVDLDHDPATVLDWKQLEGVQPMVTLDDCLDAEDVVKASPRVQQLIRERYGITDMDKVAVDPWYYGDRHVGETATGSGSGRFIQCFIYSRMTSDDNQYAHPLDIVVMLDLTTKEILHIFMHDKPPQPEGPSFDVVGNRVTWQKWDLRVGFNYKEGIVLHNVSYEDRGRKRPVLHRASIVEIIVPYGDPRAPFHRKCAFDVVDYGLGLSANSLELGCDCLGHIKYFDAVVNDKEGEPVVIKKAICMHEEDYGTLFKHTEYRNGHSETRRSRRLVISMVATIANYDYGFAWHLYQDGTIEQQTKLTGCLSTNGLSPGEGPIPTHGTLVAPGLNAQIHQHFFCARLDFALDDPNGGAHLTVTETDVEAMPEGPDNPYGVGFKATERDLTTEKEAQRCIDVACSRIWKIKNKHSLNPVNGQPVGYKLMAGPVPPLYAGPNSSHRKRGIFATKQLWVTPHSDDEIYPAGKYPLQSQGQEGIGEWTSKNRKVVDADCVMWHTFGVTHIPRIEDWPVMPAEHIGFMLKPFNFFDANPGLDIPPSCNIASREFDGKACSHCGPSEPRPHMLGVKTPDHAASHGDQNVLLIELETEATLVVAQEHYRQGPPRSAKAAQPVHDQSSALPAPLHKLNRAASATAAQQPSSLDAEMQAKKQHARKRVAIAAEALTNAADVQITNVPKSGAELRILERAVEGNLLFESLASPARQAIFGSMTALMVRAGTNIITQGDTDASKFYVLERGTCDVYVDTQPLGTAKKVHTYASGSGFGELALLYSAPRAATVTAITDCKLWVMDRNVYKAISSTYQANLAREKRVLLDAVAMLSMLSDDHKAMVADALEAVEFTEGQVVFQEGDVGSKFYIIKDGNFRVSRGEQLLEQLSTGHFFGEKALIRNDTRVADVTAESYSVCYVLDRKAFDDLLGPIEDVWKFEVLRKVPILFNLTEAQLFEVARCMKAETMRAGEMAFRKGDPGDVFYVIEEGTFTIFDNSNRELARVGKGSCFGELALLRQDVRAANVRALTDAQLLAMHRDDFNKLLGSLTDIRYMWRFEALRKVPLLTFLSPAQRSQLCTALKPQHVPANSRVITKGESGDTFYIIEAGLCAVLGDADQELSQAGPTMFFGELALLKGAPRAASVKTITECDLLTMDRDTFSSLLGPLQSLLDEQAALYGPTVSAKLNVKLGDLQKVAVLGAGAFGMVTLVKHRSTYFALKTLGKEQIVKMGLQEHVKREKEVMAACDCPFMVNLVTALKDEAHLYMLMECVMGGEFFTYLQSRTRPLNEEQARFYTASVVLGMEYMQDRNLVWRDLKPENLLLDVKGYLKMADFGFAKKLPAGQKTYTLCGTPEYLAPELVTQAGHTRAVDWWALGVLIYEMVASYPPFYDEDRVAMFKNICRVKYTCPTTFSKDLRDLVRKLLVLNPTQRLGAMKGGAADVKAHPWFAGFDWKAFEAKKMPAPYVPKVSNPEDTRNFMKPTEDPSESSGHTRYKSTGVFEDF